MGQEVYRATDFDILPLNPNISVQYPPHPAEGHLLALVQSHLNNSLLLFSYGWDLTTRLQAQWATQERTQRQALWEAACDSFSLTCSFLTIIVGR
jgi:phosphatidylinositol 4-phosphatase